MTSCTCEVSRKVVSASPNVEKLITLHQAPICVNFWHKTLPITDSRWKGTVNVTWLRWCIRAFPERLRNAPETPGKALWWSTRFHQEGRLKLSFVDSWWTLSATRKIFLHLRTLQRTTTSGNRQLVRVDRFCETWQKLKTQTFTSTLITFYLDTKISYQHHAGPEFIFRNRARAILAWGRKGSAEMG